MPVSTVHHTIRTTVTRTRLKNPNCKICFGQILRFELMNKKIYIFLKIFNFIVFKKPTIGCQFNKQRHIAKQFGPDVTEKILTKFGISLLIRSHECKDEGYEFHHNNKCITIFSASNYCGGINKGSIGVIRPKEKLEIKQFIAPGSGEIDKERIELFEAKAIRGLKRLLYANRSIIREEFKLLDAKNTGYLRYI